MSTQNSIAPKLMVDTQGAPIGSMGQKLLVSGNAIAMRLWDEDPGEGEAKSAAARNYETVGYVLSGRAELTIERKTLSLEPGVSWVVPEGTEHSYKIIEKFRAVEATHPSARGDG